MPSAARPLIKNPQDFDFEDPYDSDVDPSIIIKDKLPDDSDDEMEDDDDEESDEDLVHDDGEDEDELEEDEVEEDETDEESDSDVGLIFILLKIISLDNIQSGVATYFSLL